MIINPVKNSLLLLSILATASYAQTEIDKNEGKLHHQRGKSTRIIGGEIAPKGEYNYMTSLQSGGQHICGASFLGGKWVLTAAHCVDGMSGPGNGLEVLIGAHDFSDQNSGKRVAIQNIYSHQDYNSPVSTNNDMALLELVQEVDAPSIKILSKADANAIAAGTLLTVTGWGNTLTEGVSYPDQLMKVEVPLVSNEVCNSAASYDGGITDSMICAGYQAGGKDSCQGDSGGPLVYKLNGQWQQMGVVSFGEGCAQPDKYGVYAAAFNFHDWVDSHTKGVTVNSQIQYGAVEANSTVEKTLNVTNNSDGVVKLSDFILSGDGSSQITLNSSSCAELAAKASCTLTASYKATSALGENVQISINTDNPFSPTLNINVAATFLSPASEDIGKAADSSEISWYSESTNPWATQSAQSTIGNDAIQAGTINDSESSMIMAKVSGPAKLLFHVKTSTESGYDFFDVFLDGERVFYTTGETDFEGRFIEIPSGEHRVTFEYVKDEEQSGGNDTVYLDGFERIVKATETPAAPVVPPTAKKSSGGSANTMFLILLMFAGLSRTRLYK
jgi:secreted trypsin-like serine protease